jgi:hypothetical protein
LSDGKKKSMCRRSNYQSLKTGIYRIQFTYFLLWKSAGKKRCKLQVHWCHQAYLTSVQCITFLRPHLPEKLFTHLGITSLKLGDPVRWRLQRKEAIAELGFLFSCSYRSGLRIAENKKPRLSGRGFFSLAEREGFEPSVPLPVRQFSKLFLSASQASLQCNIICNFLYNLI